jgi:hypothetical protein
VVLLGLCLLSFGTYVVGELSSVDYWYYVEPRTSASTYIAPEFPPSGGKSDFNILGRVNSLKEKQK